MGLDRDAAIIKAFRKESVLRRVDPIHPRLLSGADHPDAEHPRDLVAAGEAPFPLTAGPAHGQSGYAGRTGIFELLVVDDTIREQIHHSAAEADIRAAAQRAGMTLMRDDGQRLVDTGITTLEELLRVTRD